MLKNLVALLLCSSLLAGCGQMGALYLPPPTPAKNTNQTHLDQMLQNT